MKRFPKSILRACCAIAGGVVLVQYREQAVMWITVGIGIVFFISAVISFIDYLALRKTVKSKWSSTTLRVASWGSAASVVSLLSQWAVAYWAA